jgi:predicted transcriptional regulator
MAAIKISSRVDEKVWNELRSMARDSHQSVSGLLTEAIREYLERRRVRPVVIEHLEHSVADNERLGELLAR